MFRQHPLKVSDLMRVIIRQNGLETPLLQRRLVESWDAIAGELIAKYTTEKYIRNQDLCVHIENPALRSEVSMMKTELIRKLNNAVGGQVIREIRLI